MGTVYKETYTKPLPIDAEVFTRKGERLARWHDKRDRKRTAKVTTTSAGERLLIEAGTYTAKYRDGSGIVRKVSTKCRTLDAAKAVLTELERRSELVKANVLTTEEDAIADHQNTLLGQHFSDYVAHLQAKSVSVGRIKTTRSRLDRIAGDCDFGRLTDLNVAALERWLVTRKGEGMSAAARNGFREAWVSFGNWCKQNRRLVDNPFAVVPKANEKADPRRKRRALTENELCRLLHVARVRPLAEYGRETVKLSPGQRNDGRTRTKEPLTHDIIDDAAERARNVLANRPDVITKLEHVGRERALIYKALVLTGLRKAELASLTVGKLDLDGPTAYATVEAADEKAGRGANVPLRADLADDLRQWLADRLEAVRREVRASNDTIPAKLSGDVSLFYVPTGLVRILDRDLAAAGIPKRDDRGRTVDVHAMRHTFGTHLSKGGVTPRTAQAAMRHSTLDLTMNTYTDPRLLDVAGAMDVLPLLPLDDRPSTERAKATGTDAAALVPVLVPTTGNQSISGPTADTPANGRHARNDERRTSASDAISKRKPPLSSGDNDGHLIGVTGFEPTTSSPRTKRSTKLSYTPRAGSDYRSGRCLEQWGWASSLRVSK